MPQVDRGQEEAADTFPGRVLNPHNQVPEIARIWADETMTAVVSLLLGAKATPFQTIAGHKGSEQLSHSDSIHMTTYPLGYLAANWIAFEDIEPDSGPLEYYPGSHRLPYLFSKDVGISIEESTEGYAAYHAKYEPAVAALIAENNLKPAYFLPKKGDVLIWHANLLHGGSRRRNVACSRKALVCHFFAKGCVCYHDYVGALSYLHPTKVPFAQFDGEAYLQANPDVREAGVDPWEHYLAFGYEEERQLSLKQDS
jgi:ectoine hydroxylase-related dioxygenase (phytanoyl-CoA dioxygenase family)